MLTLPMPPQLALPLAAGARLQVGAGATVTAGQLLADGDKVADLRAPAAAWVSAVSRRRLATGKTAICVVLEVLDESPPPPLAGGGDLPTLLRRAGVVGLGGGAFPAWRKWRPQLRLFVANAVGSDPLARCDEALLADDAAAALAATVRVGAAFADAAVFAVAVGASMAFSHPIVRSVPHGYAMGDEHLLIKQVSGLSVPPAQPPADYGAVCFNLGTVLAMAAALDDGAIMCGRMLTAHIAADRAVNLRVPFGATVGDVRRFLKLPAAGADGQQAPDDAVIDAACNALDFFPRRAAAPALPCVRCNACAPACPARLSPMVLYQAATAADCDGMAAQRLDDCLECRRCDEVCPSRIPLTAVFIHGKEALQGRRIQRKQQRRWRDKHAQHQQRLQKPIKRLAVRDILANIGGGA